MEDTAMHICAASFLSTQSRKEIWRTILSYWSMVYAGPPDYLRVDQCSAHTSKEMRENLGAADVKLKEAQIETAGTIRTVERYHATIRATYEKVRKEMSREHTGAEYLWIAVFHQFDGWPRRLVPDVAGLGCHSKARRDHPIGHPHVNSKNDI